MALQKYKIIGGTPLMGEIEAAGAKNAALPVMALSLLTEQACSLQRCPQVSDVDSMSKLLQGLGCSVERKNQQITIDSRALSGFVAPYDVVRKMRASIVLLGPLMARLGRAMVSMPGGCAIGVRPVDLHLKALRDFGAEISISNGNIDLRCSKLVPARHRFEKITVLGTINALMVAAMADGDSSLLNCAMEPEVVQVCEVLQTMGVNIENIGEPTLNIRGCSSLQGFNCELIADRIEVGTYLLAGAITKGKVGIRGAQPQHLLALLGKLAEIGISTQTLGDVLWVEGPPSWKGVELVTQEYPGFPTDMQAQIMALLSLAQGISVIHESIFENRFMHVPELIRMGAKLNVDGHTVTVEGVHRLIGAPVMCTDLRASASLVLAGLAAQGVTEVLRMYHLDRGYESMDQKLIQLGANIERLAQDG